MFRLACRGHPQPFLGMARDLFIMDGSVGTGWYAVTTSAVASYHHYTVGLSLTGLLSSVLGARRVRAARPGKFARQNRRAKSFRFLLGRDSDANRDRLLSDGDVIAVFHE